MKMRAKTTYGQLKVGDRFFHVYTDPKCICRLKTASGTLTHFADGSEMSTPEYWRDYDEVWIDIKDKLKQQATKIKHLKEVVQALYDELNCEPATRNEEHWNNAMTQAEECLRKDGD